jgi:hypothetical protein
VTERDPFPLIEETDSPSELPTLKEWLSAGAPMREVTPRVPEWPCLCGARNRLRDTTCRNCGDPAPDWKDDYDDRRD